MRVLLAHIAGICAALYAMVRFVRWRERLISRWRFSSKEVTDLRDDSDSCPRCGGSFEATGGKPAPGFPYVCQRCCFEGDDDDIR